MHFFGTCFHRFMEGYDQWLSDKEYEDMIHARNVMPVVRKYELEIRRQVKYPDTVRVAHIFLPPPPQPKKKTPLASEADVGNSLSQPTARNTLSPHATTGQRVCFRSSSRLSWPWPKAPALT